MGRLHTKRRQKLNVSTSSMSCKSCFQSSLIVLRQRSLPRPVSFVLLRSFSSSIRIGAMEKFSDSFTFLPQGGIIQEFKVGGKNIILGFPSAASYKSKHSPFFGENIGRVANRISGAKINDLNGKSYSLAANNGPNSLHGGVEGWGKKDTLGLLSRGNDTIHA